MFAHSSDTFCGPPSLAIYREAERFEYHGNREEMQMEYFLTNEAPFCQSQFNSQENNLEEEKYKDYLRVEDFIPSINDHLDTNSSSDDGNRLMSHCQQPINKQQLWSTILDVFKTSMYESHTSETCTDEDLHEDTLSQLDSTTSQNTFRDRIEISTDETHCSMSDLSIPQNAGRKYKKVRGEYKKRKEFSLSHTYAYLIEHTLEGRLITLLRKEGHVSPAMLLNFFESERETLRRTDGSNYMKGSAKRILIGVLSDNRKKGVFKKDRAGNWSIGSNKKAEDVMKERLKRITKQRASYKKKLSTKKKRCQSL